MNDCCIIPVRASDALLWWEGKLADRDLLLKTALRPEAVFIVNLPDRRSYLPCLRRTAYWRERGAIILIARTGTPSVARHLLKNGCVPGLTEHTDPPKTRYCAPPDVFARWIGRMMGCAWYAQGDAPGVTTPGTVTPALSRED